MPYCDKAELEKRFGVSEISQLLDRDNNGSEDTGTLTACIAYADALIDGYLSGLYAVPIDPAPVILVGISCDITRFKLWDDNAPEEVRRRYSDAMAILKEINRGNIAVPGTAASTAKSPSVDYAANERAFTLETMRDF